MTPEEMLARMEAMFQTLVADHEARIKVLEQKNTIKQIIVSTIASVVVAVIAQVAG